MKNAFILIFLSLFLINCAGEKTVLIDTYGMRLISGELKTFEYIDGVKGKLLDSKPISTGNVELSIGKGDEAVIIELSGATFVDIASNMEISFSPSDRWSTIVFSEEADHSRQKPIQINPLTSLGVALASYKIPYSIDGADAVAQSKTLIGDHFKLNIDSSPVNRETTPESSSGPAGLRYFLTLAGLSELAKEISQNNSSKLSGQVTINDLTRVLIEDICNDGLFDGFSKNGHLKIGDYAFSDKTLKEDLVNAILNFMSQNGIKEDQEIFSFLQNMLNDSSELFSSQNNFDFESPEIVIVAPKASDFIRGVTPIEIRATDSEGISYLTSKVYSSNQDPLVDLDPAPSTFTGAIDTKAFKDGPLSIVASAEDTSGNIAEKLFTFYVDNSPPAYTTNLKNSMVVRDIISIRIEAKDGFGSGVSSAKVLVGGVELENLQRIDSSTFSAELNTATLPENNNTVEIEISDNAGNSAKDSYVIFVNNMPLSKDLFAGNAGSFLNGSVYSTIFAGDLNDDGYPDIVNSRNILTGNVLLHFGNKDNDYSKFVILGNPAVLETMPLNAFPAGDCDINGDNFKDLAVGSPNENLGTGKLFAFMGPFNTLGKANSIISTSNPKSVPLPTDGFGLNVECEDLNGDGFDDIIVNMKTINPTYVYFGPTLATSTSINNIQGRIFRAGDINGDGIADIVIENKVIYGNRSKSFSLFTTLPSYDSISYMGDIDNNGFDDLLIGHSTVPNHDNLGFGHIQILYGGSQFPRLNKTIYPAHYSADFGKFVASGDIDGDGITDIVVGSPKTAIDNASEAGEISLFFGPDFASYRIIKNPRPESNDHFGTNIRSGFDLNLDGRDDLIVQEPGKYSEGSKAGSFHVLFDDN